MTHDEMVEVIEHHKNGGKVECIYKEKDNDTWELICSPCWDFDTYDYRIKEKLKTKMVWFWKVRLKDGWYITSWMQTEEEIKKAYHDALEYKRLDILGSEEVPND